MSEKRVLKFFMKTTKGSNSNKEIEKNRGGINHQCHSNRKTL